MRRSVNLLIIILCSSVLTAGQIKSIGTPFIKNFSRSEYKGGNQTWAIQHASNGLMYFANNNGLLEYDGSSWKQYSLPNKSIIRSLKEIDKKLYAGGFNELGYFSLNKNGGTKYHSLINIIPEDNRDFGEVWKIYSHADGIIFQTYTQIMILKNNKFSIIKAPTEFHFSYLASNEFYVNDREQGLLRYAMGKLYPLFGTEKLKGEEIWGIVKANQNLIISTASKGYFIYDGNKLIPGKGRSNDFLKTNQIYCCNLLPNDIIAFGTIQNGLLLTDMNLNPIQNISMKDGLQNNTILSMHVDFYGNLWLGTDGGIDYVQINSPIKFLEKNYGLSTGYASILMNNILYLGTNRGLFAIDINKLSDFGSNTKQLPIIENSKGQVWTLNNIDGTLFCGHNNGTYIIENGIANQISVVPGAWDFKKIPSENNLVIGGNYNGICLYEKQNNKWHFIKKYDNFQESSRSFEFDKNGSLWVVHGYKGVYHISFDADYTNIINTEYFNTKNSSLNSLPTDIFKFEDKLYFVCPDGFYTLNNKTSKFELTHDLENIIPAINVSRVINHNDSDLWYFQDQKLDVSRRLEDGSFTMINAPFTMLSGNFVNSFESVSVINGNNSVIGTDNGFAIYTPSNNKNINYKPKVFIRSINSYSSDGEQKNYTIDTSLLVFNYHFNSPAFTFSSNDFPEESKILFSSLLDGYDNEWTNWQSDNKRQFTNLFEGTYVFKFRAISADGNITEVNSVHFRVLPPFYRSITAYIFYIFVIIGLLILFIFFFRRRINNIRSKSIIQQEEEFRKKEAEMKRNALENEKELIKMRNDKLRHDMKLKDKELANSTMQMLQKNEILISLKKELRKLAMSSRDENSIHEVKHLLRKIDKEIGSENQWKVFETHFESVHEEFLKRIKIEFPNLTPRELKLCAYLRMNISSKEISVLMNISTRGVEISRYRLRKKLNLAREDNLTNFILNF